MRRRPELMQLEMGISTRRYFPASGTAGLERSRVRGKSRVPWPAAHDHKNHVAGVGRQAAGGVQHKYPRFPSLRCVRFYTLRASQCKLHSVGCKFKFMCGIVGYVGKQSASPIIIEGLRRLEYRGYDSAGVAILDGNAFQTRRKKGRIDDGLARLVQLEPLRGRLG